MKKLSFLLISISLILFSCSLQKKSESEVKKAKNIILLIGDGMGVTQIYAAMSTEERPLAIEKFKHIGFHKTYSASDYITDSGAGGTALATGTKTKNKCIAVDTLGNALETILEIAEKKQLATGLVATSGITHATPASFIAHEVSRNDYENIARDFLDVDIDIFIGGGKKHFAQRKDSLNLLDSLRARNYVVIDGVENLETNKLSKFAVFTADGHNPKILDGEGICCRFLQKRLYRCFLNPKKDSF